MIKIIYLFIFKCFFLNVFGRPIQLARPNKDHSGLEIVPEGINLLKSIPGPLAIISAVGTIHSGKSFLLNQLILDPSIAISKDTPFLGFSVGYTVQPETSGIWTHSEIIEIDGTRVLFIDTEGLFSNSASSNYDAKMFAISTLLSSEIIYNTVKFIDNQQIDMLETLIRRTNLFGLRAYAQQKSDSFNNNVINLTNFLQVLIPSQLSWVVQGFVQDLQDIQPEEWLHALLSADVTKYNNNLFTKKRDKLEKYSEPVVENFFTNIDCITLSLPLDDSEKLQKLDLVTYKDLNLKYRSEIQKFKSRLLERAKKNPKRKGGNKTINLKNNIPMNGKDVADLLEFLILSANHRSSNIQSIPFPELPSIAQQFTELQLKLMKSDIIAILERDMIGAVKLAIQKQKPLSDSMLEQEIDRATFQAEDLWTSTIKGILAHKTMEKPISEAQEQFRVELAHILESIKESNCGLIKSWCQARIGKLLSNFKNDLKINTGVVYLPKELEQKIDRLIDPYVYTFSQPFENHEIYSCCGYSLQEFKDILTNEKNIVINENDNKLNALLDDVIQDILNSHEMELQKKRNDLQDYDYSSLKSLLQELKINHIENFVQRTNKFESLDAHYMKKTALSRKIDDIGKDVINYWEVLCENEAKKFLEAARSRYKSDIRRNLSLPCEEEILDAIIASKGNDLRKDFERKVICHDSPKGQIFLKELELRLREAGDGLKKLNIKTIQDIHSHVLDQLKSVLTLEAQNFYLVNSFRAYASKKAWHVLKEDYIRVDSANADERNSAKIDNLLKKGAELFVNELEEAERAINGLLMINMTLLSNTVLSLFILNFSAKKPINLFSKFIRYLLSVVPLVILFQKSTKMKIFNMMFTQYWMHGWNQYVTAFFGVFLGFITSFIQNYSIVHDSSKTNRESIGINIPSFYTTNNCESPKNRHRNTSSNFFQRDLNDNYSMPQNRISGF